MQGTCSTVVIRTSNGPVMINESDFNPTRHDLWGAKPQSAPVSAVDDGWHRAGAAVTVVHPEPSMGSNWPFEDAPCGYPLEESEHEFVAIPDDWRDLSWPQRKSLAAKLTDDKITDSASVERAIEAELARRAKA